MWASYWTDENVLEVDRSPAAHTHVLFPQLPLSVTSAIPQPLGPRCWWTYLPRKKSIYFCGCALQFLVFCIFEDSECLLLAVTAYDQYKGISNPLLYAVSMSSGMCSLLLARVYLVGVADALIHTTLAFHLYSCGSNVINHFFCDLPPLFLLSYSDIQVNELLLFIVFGFIELSTISGVLVSYCYIILSVLKIHSALGRFKAFSTCTFYLNVVDIFQGTLLFMNFWPTSSYSPDQDKMTSLFYTFVIPMLNPLIYSLWNKNIKETLEKLKNKLCLNIFYYILYILLHIYSNCLIKIICHDTWET